MAKVQKSGVKKKYPDMSKVFREKEERRIGLANLPIEEKLKHSKMIRDAAALIRKSKRVTDSK